MPSDPHALINCWCGGDHQAIFDAQTAANHRLVHGAKKMHEAFDTVYRAGRELLHKSVSLALAKMPDERWVRYSELASEETGILPDSPVATPAADDAKYLRAITNMVLSDILWQQRDKQAESKFANAVIDPSKAKLPT